MLSSGSATVEPGVTMNKAAYAAIAGLFLALTASEALAQDGSANSKSGAKAPPVGMPVTPAGQMIHPGWAELPTSDQMSQFYPPIARLLDVTGRVRLRCHVTTADTLDQCQVISEIPQGLGFADAGMLLTPYFHLKPRPAAERTDMDFTIVPLRFALPPPDPMPPEPSGRAPSQRSVALARRLAAVVAGDADEATAEEMASLRDRLGSEVPDSILATAESQKALAALEQAWRADFPAFKEQLAQSYARIYTEPDLARIVIFMESPVGRRWQSRKKQSNEMHSAAWERLWRTAESQASTHLCEEIQCAAPGPSRPAGASPVDQQ